MVVQKVLKREFNLPFSKDICVSSIYKVTHKSKTHDENFYFSKYTLNKQSNESLNLFVIEVPIKLTMATFNISFKVIDDNNTLMELEAVGASPTMSESIMKFVNVFSAICDGKSYTEAMNENSSNNSNSGSGCILVFLAIIIPSFAFLYLVF